MAAEAEDTPSRARASESLALSTVIVAFSFAILKILPVGGMVAPARLAMAASPALVRTQSRLRVANRGEILHDGSQVRLRSPTDLLVTAVAAIA